MFVHISEFPNELRQGFILSQKVPLFVHTNIVVKNDRPLPIHTNIAMKNERSNFGGIHYESINSPFMLWKFYLDILSRVVFNVSHEFIFPLLMSGIDSNCWDFTVRTSKSCSHLKKSKIKAIFFRELVEFCENLSEFCCDNVDLCFIIDVFKKYEKGVDFFSTFLEIERKWIIFADTSGCPCHKDLTLALFTLRRNFCPDEKVHK